eukprot:g9390.t1
MDAALRSAHHDARLLSNHLKRSLGKGNETLSESAARAATTFLLAQGDTHGDLDTEKALRLSRVVPPPATARGTPQDTSCDAMDVEGDKNTDAAAAGNIRGETLRLTPGEQHDSTITASSQTMSGISNAENSGEATTMDGSLAGGGHGPSRDNTSSVVNRRRLIAVLAAEERISAMASHLGSADPMTHLRSLLLPEQASSTNWFSRGPAGVPGEDQPQLKSMRSLSVVLCESSAGDEGLKSAAAAAVYPSERVTDGLPRLGGDGFSGLGGEVYPSGGQGKPAQRKQRRSRSAEDNLVSSSQSGPWDNCVADELIHVRKKRSREGGVANHGEELLGPGSFMDDVPQSGLARSRSFGTDQRQGMMAPEAAVTENWSFCSLPKLKVSRRSCRHSASDDYDRFGGRETPTVLRRASLSGGGEHSKRAVEELRQQLEITEDGLLDLRARVRADVAWVQETVGAKMSRRARVSCCKWGSEKIAELAHRWERRSLVNAVATWTRHREYMSNRDLVRAFIKRKGAAKARRLLEVWGHRLTSRALEEWRRRVRLEKRAEEAAAASKLQRVALGFLGRRRFRCALATGAAIRIQKAARGRAGRKHAARANEDVRRNAAARKIQDQAKKRGERRRAQRIVALKNRRRAAVKIQKCARGLMGRRKGSTRREELLRERESIVIQAAWRGLLGRRRAGQTRRDLEAMLRDLANTAPPILNNISHQAAQNKAAVHIQAAQRRKAAMAAADARRRVRALQRRKSAEIAAVSIQRVARGRAARAAMEAEAARREKRQRAAAAVHIQRVARGRAARKLAASVSISREVPVPPLPQIQTPPMETKSHPRDREEEDGGVVSSPAASDGHNEGIVAAELAEEGGTEASAPPCDVDGDEHLGGVGALPRGSSVEVGDEKKLLRSADRLPASEEQGQEEEQAQEPVAAISKAEEAARARAAAKIQAIGRGKAARAEACNRKKKREAEEARRASVWGQPDQKETRKAASRETSGAFSSPSSPTTAAVATPPAPRTSSSLFAAAPDPSKATAASRRGQPEAATLIQAAFRGGRARWDADLRRKEFQQRKAEAVARAQEKRETDAAVRIQTQARARAARVQRERHRQRHAARVGSIRSSGRAAADDLRALSRPGTAAAAPAAAAPAAATDAAVSSTGEGGGDVNLSVWDGAAEALLPTSMGLMSTGSMGSVAPADPGWGALASQPHGSGSFSLPAAIGVAAVRAPLSVGSPNTVTATFTNTSPGKGSDVRAMSKSGNGGGRKDGGRRSLVVRKSSNYADSRPGSGNSINSSRKASVARGSPTGRSRSPSAASPSRSPSPARSAQSMVRRSVTAPGSSGTTTPTQSRRSATGHGHHRGVSGAGGGAMRESSAGSGGAGGEWGGMEMSLEDVERMHREMRKGIENELHRELREKIDKELATKLAEQEEERQRVLREAEEDRKRDQGAMEEAVRAVQEAHNKDSEEIARIKARLEEEEAARRAEQDAGRQEYERSLAEIRAEALAEAEKSRLAVEAVEALRREVEKEAQEHRRRQEEAEAQAKQREQEEREEKERRREAEQRKEEEARAGDIEDGYSSAELQRQQEQKEKEGREKLRRQQLEQQQQQQQQQQQSVMQQLAAENVERQRVALVQLQEQLREEEAKRLEAHAAWEARQAEEEEIAKEERRLELEAIESLKRQLEEDKIRATQEQELRNAEVRMQMESLRALQEKVQEQERVRLEAERAAQAEQKAKEDAVIREGANLMQEDNIESDEDSACDKVGEDGGGGVGGSAGSNRPKSTGTLGSTGSSRGTSAGMLVPADVEEAVKREIESATGSRLAQVEGALLELSRKQAELESREKQLAETAGAYLGDSASPTNTALVEATIGGTSAADAPSSVDTGDAAVASTGVVATGVEWVEYWDESAGASYFFNTVTQEASWTNPHESAPGGGGAGTGGAAGVEGGGSGPETLSQPEDGRAKWTECIDEASGATYYYNVVTGEAVWEKPAELARKTEMVAGVPQFERPEEWVCYLDENSGEEYWFNVTTGETHWGATES